VTGLGAVAGLGIGGVVTEHLGWRWIFTGNAVVATLVGISVLALLPGGTGDRNIRIEPLGALLATLGLSTAVYALHGTLEHGWTSGHTVLLGLAAAAAFALAAATWRRAAAPLVPATLLRDRQVLVSDGCAVLTGGAMLGTFYFVSLQLQGVLGYTPVGTAMAYLPLLGGLVLAAGLASPLVPRVGVRPVLVAGMLCCGGGLALLGRLGMTVQRDGYWSSLAPGLAVCGLGLGLAFVSLTVTAVPGGEQSADGGVASGLYNTALQVGGALGVAGLATVSTGRAGDLLEMGRSAAEAVTEGRVLALYVAAGLMGAGTALAALLPAAAGRSAGAGSDTGDHAGTA
jgi:MFS family permease